jgi:hypothetical protein
MVGREIIAVFGSNWAKRPERAHLGVLGQLEVWIRFPQPYHET